MTFYLEILLQGTPLVKKKSQTKIVTKSQKEEKSQSKFIVDIKLQ